MRTRVMSGVVALGVLGALLGLPGTAAEAAPLGQDFEALTLGPIDGQAGWSVTNPAFDFAVADTAGMFGGALGTKALRVSNAVTSGSFGDQLFSAQTPDEAGETSAENGGLSGGTRQTRYRTSFTFASAVPDAYQPGLEVGVSPDRGDGARMSLVRLYDTAAGLKVTAFGFNTNDGGAFPETVVAAGLDRSVPHSLSLTMDFLDGPSNDRVSITVDGGTPVVIGSWEQYFRDAEHNPSRTVDSLLVRAFPHDPSVLPLPDPAALAGKGFLIDAVTQQTGPTPAPVQVARTLSPTQIATQATDWRATPETDWPSSATARFVDAPAGALGAHALKVSLGPVTGANNGKYYLGRSLPGVPVGDLTGLRYRVLTDPANNGTMQPYVNIPVSGGGVAYANLVYDPNDPASNPQPLPTTNGVWRTFDPFSPSARWRATRVLGGKAQWTYRTLSEWLQLVPDLRTHPVAGGVFVVFGASQVYAPWTDFVGYLDSFDLTVAGTATHDTFDAGAPLSPTSVVASDLHPRAATVSWTPDAGTALAPVDSYEVVVDGTPQTVAPGVATLDVGPLLPGSTHRVSVRAVRGAATGPWVATSFAAPNIALPAAVAGLVAGAVTTTSAMVSWTADPTVGDGAVDGYEVTGLPGGPRQLAGTTVALTGLTPGSGYTATVRAHNWSGWSPAVSATFTTTDLDRRTPGAPTLVVGLPDVSGTVPVTWSANLGDSPDFPVLHWVVTVDGADEAALPSGTTTYNVTGLTPGRHTVSVRGVNALGSDAFAAQVLVVAARPAPDLPRSSVLVATPRVITVGTASRLAGRFTVGGAARGDALVTLWAGSGSSWVPAGSTVTGADGSFGFSVSPSATTRYRAITAGLPSAFATVSVRPKVVVRFVYTAASGGRHLVRLAVSVAPGLVGTKVQLQRLVGRVWRTTATTRLGRGSRQVFTLGLFTRSTARYRVQVPGTARTLPATSVSVVTRIPRR